nr:MAG TPA: hypothetical protein [Caudoviricetes sp.]
MRYTIGAYLCLPWRCIQSLHNTRNPIRQAKWHPSLSQRGKLV